MSFDLAFLNHAHTTSISSLPVTFALLFIQLFPYSHLFIIAWTESFFFSLASMTLTFSFSDATYNLAMMKKLTDRFVEIQVTEMFGLFHELIQ
jgi:hypothetical protein